MKILLSNKLVVVGWVLFLLCLITPAAIENEGAIYGYQYAQLANLALCRSVWNWTSANMTGLA